MHIMCMCMCMCMRACVSVHTTQVLKYTAGVLVLVAGVVFPLAQVQDSRCERGNGESGHVAICLGEAQHSCCEEHMQSM